MAMYSICGIAHDLDVRNEALHDAADFRSRDDDLEQEADTDHGDERDDERLEQPEALVLQVEHDEHVERGDRDAPGERDAEEQVERDRGADDFGQVARGDGDFAQHPEREPDRLGVVIATRLREVAAGDDAEL